MTTTTTTLRARRTATAVILALLVSLLGAAGPWTRSAHAATFARTPVATFDSHLLGKINHARVVRGMHRLILVAGTTDIAHGWACHMARYHVLAHNGGLSSALLTHGSRLWTSYAENVGYVRSSRRAAA